MYAIRYTLAFICITLLFACNSGKISKDEKGREDFYEFYDKFYADSAFQMQRIEFPMIGEDPQGDAQKFYWTEENWKRQQALDFEDDKYKCFITDMENTIHEKIIIEKTFVVVRYYSLINNKWYLTSYSGIKDAGSMVKPKPEVQKDTIDPDAPTIEIMSNKKTEDENEE